MFPDTVRIGNLDISRVIVGGNPVSGFSHQTPAKDEEMRRYFTTERIKQMLRSAEGLGVRTHIARADHHVMRYLLEYWDEGGTIQWIAQTCPEVGTSERGVANALNGRAAACYIHGGLMDYLLANGGLDQVPPAIARIRDAGLPAGIAGHNPDVFRWAADHLDVDFYMCSYYNSAHRDGHAEHRSGMAEWFHDSDRTAMTQVLATLPRPVIHYKVFAAGRNDPADALGFVARCLRPSDAVCLGIYPKDHPHMLAENLRLLSAALDEIDDPEPQQAPVN